MNRSLTSLLFVVLIISVCGCQKAYYGTMEKLGKPKREILVDRVQDARDGQTAAKEQFMTTLDRFSSVVNFQGGELEEVYKDLKRQYDKCSDRADAVRSRIVAVRDVAEALFDEWNEELDDYTNPQLKRLSQVKLDTTRRNYDTMIEQMERAKIAMDPVLKALSDQVLFLKHNLNAQAIVSLREELVWVRKNTSELIKEMEASIEQANKFIGEMAAQ